MRLTLLALTVVSITSCGRSPSLEGSRLADDAQPARVVEVNFHWGSIAANNELLRSAGYPSPETHAAQPPAPGVDAPFNQALVNATREWFNRGNRGDAAGPGLYISTNPFDSSSYGPDLIVVELTGSAEALAAINQESSMTVYQRNVAFMDHPETTPPRAVSQYTESWRVATRVPTEADGFTMRVRPPRPEDAAIFARQLGRAGPEVHLNSILTARGMQAGMSGNRTAPAAAMLAAFAREDLVASALELDFASMNTYTFPRFMDQREYIVSDDLEKLKRLNAALLEKLLAATHPLQAEEAYDYLIETLQSADAPLKARIQAKFAADLKRLYVGADTMAVVASIEKIVEHLSLESRTEIAATVLPHLANAAIQTNSCGQHLEQLDWLFTGTPAQSEMVNALAAACFRQVDGMTRVQPGTFYNVYFNLAQRIKSASQNDTARLAAFLRGARPSDPLALAAAATLVAATADDAQRDALKAELTSIVADAAPATQPAGTRRYLAILYAAKPWIKTVGFVPGMILLSELVPQQKPALIEELRQFAPTLSDSVEKNNIEELIRTLAGDAA